MIRAIIQSIPICALFAALVWSLSPAWANGDTVLMRENPDGHLAEVYYMNSAKQSSSGVNRVFEYDGVQARVRVQIGGGDVNFAEIITVTPVDAQHMVLPEGPQEVMDGSDIIFVIMLPMF